MQLEISTDPTRLDLPVIHDFLCNRSYWSRGLPMENLQRRIDNSICFGGYVDGEQVAFARVISDRESFAYLADVFVLESYRGLGFSKMLMQAIVEHPDLQNLRRWLLATLDAHELYKQFGFKALGIPERWMERANMAVYQTAIHKNAV